MKDKIGTIVLIVVFIAIMIGISLILKSENEKQMGSVKTNKAESNVIEVTSSNFEEEVLKSDRLVLIDFYADWCGPCKMLEPIVNEFSSENEDIKVVRINIDEEAELAYSYDIMSIPTLVVIENGEESSRVVGVVEKEIIEEMCNK